MAPAPCLRTPISFATMESEMRRVAALVMVAVVACAISGEVTLPTDTTALTAEAPMTTGFFLQGRATSTDGSMTSECNLVAGADGKATEHLSATVRDLEEESGAEELGEDASGA